MSLQTLLVDLATTGGIKIGNAEQKQYLTYRINKAAQELFDNFDLVGSLREQIYNVDMPVTGGNQISLPSYVGKMRAVRTYYPSGGLALLDMRPKYQPKFWQGKNFLGWRLKGEQALASDVTNASLLTITFKQPLEKALTVTITGKTDYSSDFKESLSFEIGDTSKTTVASFIEVVSITKNDYCSFDADIIDIDDNILGILPNNQVTSSYQIVSIFNGPNAVTTYQPITQYVEVLWKLRFKPFVNDTDEFVNPAYEKCIIWKFLEHKMISSSDATDRSQAYGYAQKCGQQISSIAQDTEGVINKTMNLAPNNYLSAFENLSNYTNSPGYYPNGVAY